VLQRIGVSKHGLYKWVNAVKPNGKPLNIGRKTRTMPTAIKRALVARDKGCAFPGCHHPLIGIS
jgi:hypothetical protein